MTTKLEEALQLLREVNRLKRIPRMGWLLRGIGPADAESVAEHSYGTAATALLLADLIDEPVDRGRLLTICLLHDLPESRLQDLAPAAIQYLGAEAKRDAEEATLADQLAAIDGDGELQRLWLEFAGRTSPEGRLARDADALEMMIQAQAYEEAGWRGLDEFWEGMEGHRWEFAASEALLRTLMAQR